MKSISDAKFAEVYKIAKANNDISLLIDLASYKKTKKNAKQLERCIKIKANTEIIKFSVPRYSVDGDYNLVVVEGFYLGTNWYHCKVNNKHRLILMFSVEMVDTLDEIFNQYERWVEEQNSWEFSFTKTQYKAIRKNYENILKRISI